MMIDFIQSIAVLIKKHRRPWRYIYVNERQPSTYTARIQIKNRCNERSISRRLQRTKRVYHNTTNTIRVQIKFMALSRWLFRWDTHWWCSRWKKKKIVWSQSINLNFHGLSLAQQALNFGLSGAFLEGVTRTHANWNEVLSKWNELVSIEISKQFADSINKVLEFYQSFKSLLIQITDHLDSHLTSINWHQTIIIYKCLTINSRWWRLR